MKTNNLCKGQIYMEKIMQPMQHILIIEVDRFKSCLVDWLKS